mgnify:CR=1 FL=1
MQFPITIGLHRSRLLDFFVVSGALLASGGALALPAAMFIQVGVVGLTGLLVFWSIRQLTLKISAIRLEQNGELSLFATLENEFKTAKILPGATVHPWLTVVRFKFPEQPARTLMVTVDSLKAKNFRRLRVFLRWRADFNGLNDDV